MSTLREPRRLASQAIPRLEVEDTLIRVGPLMLTARQTGILILGGCVIFDVWKQCQEWLTWGTTGQVLRIVLVGLLSLLCLTFAYGRLYGRTTEIWLLVLCRYWFQPKRCLWQRSTNRVLSHAPSYAAPGSLLTLRERGGRS